MIGTHGQTGYVKPVVVKQYSTETGLVVRLLVYQNIVLILVVLVIHQNRLHVLQAAVMVRWYSHTHNNISHTRGTFNIIDAFT